MYLTDFKALTFDCYGTLIDWETGIYNALLSLASKAGAPRSRDQLLEIFAQHESAQEQETPGMPYSQLLSVIYKRLAKEWGVSVRNEAANTFGASVPDWPEFPDSVEALQFLRKHHKLFILSNVDRISFRASNTRLRVNFNGIYTAQDVESYKPSVRNFEFMLERLKEDFDLDKGDVLHVAQSLFHDHSPANAVGLASAWIDRRHADKGWGATMPPPGTPRYEFRFDSMSALVVAHRAGTSCC